MANKKYHYYVLVITEGGPIFVTKVDNKNQVSYWDKNSKPLELNSLRADDIALGLNLNGYNAYSVKSVSEVVTQPYRYKDFDLKFVKKEV